MGLAEYKRKRHFSRTPEPAGKEAAKEGWSFVVQKHRARQLHYDFRLELEGVLKSWAVPKGPSLDPAVKRLAMHVEDHPVEYGSFEGIIPAGEYGGGTVMLWDRGTWEPLGDAHENYRKGRLKFSLHGEKLKGRWMLVKSGGRSQYVDNRHWLLFKERDEEARPADEVDVLEELPYSVATGRTIEEIAADSDDVWSSNRKARVPVKTPAARPKKRQATGPRRVSKRPPATIEGYDKARQQFHGVRLTSPDKLLYPEQGITKLELANYYREVADWVLPHIVDRPLVLVRCPEGRAKDCFYQKHPPAGTPDTLRRVSIREKNKTEPYVVADDAAGLISLAQIGTLEIHAWGSRADLLEKPDRLIFDLDPDLDVPWGTVVQAARQVRTFLNELGLQSFVKTTGGKGLHLVVPIDRRHEWDEAKEFCRQVATLIVTADPAHYTANMAKAARTGKIFVDYLRNARGATAIIPYSPRARPDAPVSAPLTWEELTPNIRSDRYTVRNVGKRLASLKADPWADIGSVRQGLAGAIKKAASLSRMLRVRA
jgi:bifunctional non-homologous end joining protein LigD